MFVLTPNVCLCVSVSVFSSVPGPAADTAQMICANICIEYFLPEIYLSIYLRAGGVPTRQVGTHTLRVVVEYFFSFATERAKGQAHYLSRDKHTKPGVMCLWSGVMYLCRAEQSGAPRAAQAGRSGRAVGGTFSFFGRKNVTKTGDRTCTMGSLIQWGVFVTAFFQPMTRRFERPMVGA